MGSFSEEQYYNTMSSLIGWAHTQNDPCDRCGALIIDINLLGNEENIDITQSVWLTKFSPIQFFILIGSDWKDLRLNKMSVILKLKAFNIVIF